MAETNQNNAAPVFVGEVRHAIDGKNRITIPSGWRFNGEVELFLIPSVSSQCLKVMPRAELDKVLAKAETLQGPERATFLRYFGSQSRQVMLDKTGRISLPEEFCRQFKLSGEVTLSGAVKTFEIWNTAEWNAAHPATKAVAHAVMANHGI